MVANMMDLDKKQKQPFKEQEAKLAAKEELLREEMKQQVQVKLLSIYLCL